MKEIEIDCPCCDARLLIDVRTRAVLRHTPKSELDEFGKPGGTAAWDRAQAKVAERGGRGTDAFDDALALEQSRENKFDDLFEKAKAKVDEKKRELDGEGDDA
ncbi:MAG: hypothetical protein ACJA2W_000311 [Planctomycetota bacterium]|jgi:hypothetical protein